MTDTESMHAQARARLKRLAADSLKTGDPTSWFEILYQSAEGNTEAIPWAHLTANSLLMEWLTRHQGAGEGKRALVVGCGLGDDAEALSGAGYAVTAFDVSAEAIAWCQRRFPDSAVQYTVADLLALPDEWHGRFDLIVEAYTLQSLPEEALRVQAADQLARCLATGGSLLVICRARDAQDERGTMPWPLTREEVMVFSRLGLQEVTLEELRDEDEPSVRRFRAHYRR